MGIISDAINSTDSFFTGLFAIGVVILLIFHFICGIGNLSCLKNTITNLVLWLVNNIVPWVFSGFGMFVFLVILGIILYYKYK